MTENCFICNKPLSSAPIVIVNRGLKHLKDSSIKRDDGHIEHLAYVNSVTVHVVCRKKYICKNRIEAHKKRRVEETLSASQCSSPRKKRSVSNLFDFKTLCLFCAKPATEELDKKKEKRKRFSIFNVRSSSFKDRVMKTASARGDKLGRIMKSRITFEFDLVSAKAKYHKPCYTNFFKPLCKGKVGRPIDTKIAASMEKIFTYENHEDCQFTLSELKDVLVDEVPNDITIQKKLIEKYGNNILITTKPKKITIICFRGAQTEILSNAWYENRKLKPAEERLRIIEAAATIIREDIRTAVVNTESYPPPGEMFSDVNAEIPKSLQFLIDEIIITNKKGKKDNLKIKCAAICHSIMSAVRPRSFSSQLLIGLSVFLHRKYGSKRLIDILANFGFSASYKETVLYEVSSIYHSAPSVLPPEYGTFIQYAADNADINVSTLDGHNTLHVMGVIKIVSPKSAVINDLRIVKCTTLPNAKEIATLSHVPLHMYENHELSGLSNIEAKDVNMKEVLGENMFNIVDLIWMYGKWKGVSVLSGWNGFLEHISKKNTNFETSRIIFLPFIHNPASNYNTIYTTLKCAVDNASSNNQKKCIVTFDQPLYIKAREIVAASEPASEISMVIVRLGGFHMLMSFLGCIGNIMAGSGIKEALSVVYAPNSVDKMLDGHAYARSVRGHTLLCRAISVIIFDDMEIQNNVHTFMDSYIAQIMNGTVSITNITDSNTIFEPFSDQFHDKLNKLKSHGNTAQLWVQYLDMVCIVHNFIRAERMGNWNEHLTAVKRMLPYFHAAGHFLYAKSSHLYLQDMLALEDKMDPLTFKRFTEGFFTVRRSNKFNCGTWTDMVIEQTLMKSMKMEGGLSRGRSTHESVLCKWVYGMHSMNAICDELEKFNGISLDTSEQHVDARDSRIKRDDEDVLKLLEWFNQHNPFPQVKHIVSLATGIIGTDEINCHNAQNIGLQSLQKIIGQTFDNIKLKRSNKVLSVSCVNSFVKVHESKVAIDPLLLFQRISLNKKFDDHLSDYLRYELSPYPTSLFDNCGMRKTQKSALYQLFQPVNVEFNIQRVTYVIDGGFLLHRVIWQQNDTFLYVVNRYVTYIQNHFGSNVVVVFDGYDDNSKNIKAMEQSRRAALVSGSLEIIFDENTKVCISQEKFLSNNCNKKKLIQMLIETFKSINIATRQARDDADVLIIETALKESITNTTVIVGEDIDLLVLLIGRSHHQQNLFFMKPGKGKIKTQFYNSSSFTKYPNAKQHILFLHAMTGCDTTSALFNRGKRNTIKIFEKRSDIRPYADIFQQSNASQNFIVENGVHILLAIYGAPSSENSLDNHRYLSFARMSKCNTAIKLSSLPPTSAAAQQHLYRVYYQVQTWLGNNIDPKQWGWILNKSFLEPIKTLLPPAPDNILNTIFCNCAKGCGGNCGCRKIGLSCSTACGNCHGQSCLNAMSDTPDIESLDIDIENDGDIDPISVLMSNENENENEENEQDEEVGI